MKLLDSRCLTCTPYIVPPPSFPCSPPCIRLEVAQARKPGPGPACGAGNGIHGARGGYTGPASCGEALVQLARNWRAGRIVPSTTSNCGEPLKPAVPSAQGNLCVARTNFPGYGNNLYGLGNPQPRTCFDWPPFAALSSERFLNALQSLRGQGSETEWGWAEVRLKIQSVLPRKRVPRQSGLVSW